jgi:hypothetical protein
VPSLHYILTHFGLEDSNSGECLKSWANEVHEVCGVSWKPLLVQLSAIEAEDKEAKSAFECQRTTREATRSSSQTGQIVTQLSVVGFDRVGIGLALRYFVAAQVIPKPLIEIKGITVIPLRFGCLIYHVLQGFLRTGPDHGPAQDTASSAIHRCQNVDLVFFSPMKVKSSSISASWTASGIGAFGKASATSVTQ